MKARPKTRRTVQLSEFWLSDREVTVGLYQRFLDDSSKEEKPIEPEAADTRISPTPDHPMQNVSWEDAVLFCNWLSRREGRKPCYQLVRRAPRKQPANDVYTPEPDFDVTLNTRNDGYRLPTEAEWEYACRARSSTEYSFGDGDTWLKRYAVYESNSKQKSLAVRALASNRWGSFDMHGNVWEWCWDWFSMLGYQKVKDPTGPSEGSPRVLRGGSWWISSADARSASWNGGVPKSRFHDDGFRLALSPSSSAGPAEREAGEDNKNE
jgi:formylglycine-generating enzyme required for sulfatase activity